jgi:hypothetical protein
MGKLHQLSQAAYAHTASSQNLKGLGAQQSIMDRLHEVAAKTKEILGESV